MPAEAEGTVMEIRGCYAYDAMADAAGRVSFIVMAMDEKGNLDLTAPRMKAVVETSLFQSAINGLDGESWPTNVAPSSAEYGFPPTFSLYDTIDIRYGNGVMNITVDGLLGGQAVRLLISKKHQVMCIGIIG